MTNTPDPAPVPAPAGRPDRPARSAVVTAREDLSPHMVRLTVRCPDLVSGALERSEFTDAYIKIEFADESGATVLRTYTIREWRLATGEFVLDFVVHGDEGLAGPWARRVTVGTEIQFRGPGGGYAPDTQNADVVHLFVGDLASLPAIEAALAQVSAGRRGQVVLAIEDAADIRDLGTHLPVEWVVDPELAAAYDRAVAFVEAWQHPADAELEVFLHGEAGFVRQLRRHVRVDRGVAKDRQSISGYWKQGSVDEQWRQEKRVWAQPIDAAEAAVDH